MERIILDLDCAMGTPGSDIDDGFALALALADPNIAVELVSTVNGNTDVATATTLTLDLLRRLGHQEIPVYRGAQLPLVRPQARFGSVPADVVVREPRPESAAVALVERVLANPGEITLVAIGPLTNVALAMRLSPEFGPSLKSLVIMGGVFTSSTNNASMPGEFNAWSDPEAAAMVLGSGVVASWVGLDVTLQVRLTRSQALEMSASDRPFVSFAGSCAAAWIDTLNEGKPAADDSCPLHDPLAVAAVSQPEFLSWRDAYVQVETGDRFRGAMLADYLDSDHGVGRSAEPSDDAGTPGNAPAVNARIAVAVAASDFHSYFLGLINQL